MGQHTFMGAGEADACAITDTPLLVLGASQAVRCNSIPA